MGKVKRFRCQSSLALPILTWPGDDWMIRTLTKHRIIYKIVFSSPDYHAKLAAAEAGIGLSALPESMVPPYLVKAKEYYLPTLPAIKALLCVRAGLDTALAIAAVKACRRCSSTIPNRKCNSRAIGY
jgi:DNA-binding transcriptional LysR family regulator